GLLAGFFGLLPALPIGGPLVGILFGPLVGAAIAELIYRRDLRLALKAALGILVGTVVGNGIQFVLAIATVAVFLFTTWSSVMGAAPPAEATVPLAVLSAQLSSLRAS
ncbi:MAG: DUF456 family protein, partial [Microcoleus sp. SIO2G3]|nr:DUF456 family protein [Microcoleus sp. SIO2G3]